ncbi:hypothetical protein QJS10_CPA08g01657 [Acorus calamus]|uniref:Uncharacterized protein n=1 Tax=Acorus calamus TaxID=4465 RepID=A0AAV9E865_ACOCL|nr:hypothetical protein QJS10_CPA08g01657 [Acorus calamus]
MALILNFPHDYSTTTRDIPAPGIKEFQYTHRFDHGSLTVRPVAVRQEYEQSNKLLFKAFEEMTSRRARAKQKLIRLWAAVSGGHEKVNDGKRREVWGGGGRWEEGERKREKDRGKARGCKRKREREKEFKEGKREVGEEGECSARH